MACSAGCLTGVPSGRPWWTTQRIADTPGQMHPNDTLVVYVIDVASVAKVQGVT
jgi:hypothetical protein